MTSRLLARWDVPVRLSGVSALLVAIALTTSSFSAAASVPGTHPPAVSGSAQELRDLEWAQQLSDTLSAQAAERTPEADTLAQTLVRRLAAGLPAPTLPASAHALTFATEASNPETAAGSLSRPAAQRLLTRPALRQFGTATALVDRTVPGFGRTQILLRVVVLGDGNLTQPPPDCVQLCPLDSPVDLRSGAVVPLPHSLQGGTAVHLQQAGLGTIFTATLSPGQNSVVVPDGICCRVDAVGTTG